MRHGARIRSVIVIGCRSKDGAGAREMSNCGDVSNKPTRIVPSIAIVGPFQTLVSYTRS